MKYPKYRVGIGQDSHRFLAIGTQKKCIIGGVIFDEAPGLDADSDGDIVYHSICNAITSLTHVPILGDLAIKLCHEKKITDSQVFLEEALKTLGKQQIVHVALTIEGKQPRLQKKVDQVRQKVADVLKIKLDQVGLTVTSGDGLSDFGRGDGIQCFCILTTLEHD
jgi:2-C-methyl-D-erythritol 2,4-cyclodiphosphate synthase